MSYQEYSQNITILSDLSGKDIGLQQAKMVLILNMSKSILARHFLVDKIHNKIILKRFFYHIWIMKMCYVFILTYRMEVLILKYNLKMEKPEH